MNIYHQEYSVVYNNQCTSNRWRVVITNDEIECQQKCIDEVYNRVKKAHPNIIFHKYLDIEVWKTILLKSNL